MHVHPEDLQPAREPLHVLDQLRVARIRADLLRRPVSERVRAGTHDAEPSFGGGRTDFAQCLGEIALGFLPEILFVL